MCALLWLQTQSFSIRRLCVEVPTADTGPATSVSLASFIVNALEDLGVEGGITVVFRDDSATALGAQNLDVSSVALDQAPSQRLGSNLIIISPAEEQVVNTWPTISLGNKCFCLSSHVPIISSAMVPGCFLCSAIMS